jgi:hypothetical protein
MPRALLTPAFALLLFGRLVAFDATLDADAIQQALAIGQSRLAQDHERFHRPYRVTVGKPPVDWIEIVTPFRRIVLAAEAKAAAGDRRFGQRQALEIAAASRDQLDVDVELSFHPLNTFVGVPEYRVAIQRGSDTPPRDPISIDRVPRFGPRVPGPTFPVPTGPVLPGGSQPMLGGTVIAHFDMTGLEQAGTYDVVIREAAEKGTRPASELARARVDFAAMR